ncbi:MAG: ATP synthase F1 subunit gamma [Muribaculaceae bacterium]|nr:ATP synthase F1 subunit gamma [Muribaculaceae bacterium]
MATLRELKGRIGSVASSEKITGAMKMISSAKMHKAESALKKQLPFRSQIEVIIGNLLSADAPVSSPLLEERHVENLGIVVWGSDDGLCGAFNVNLFKILLGNISQYRAKYGDNVKITIIPVGAKMLKAAQKIEDENITVYQVEGVDSKSDGDTVKKFTENLRDAFIGKKLDQIDILYMNFKSISRQVPMTEQLLPISSEKFNGLGVDSAASSRPYIFEPDAATIFRAVLPLYLLSLMQEVFTENRAAEQAARVMAMQSANDNAKKLLEQLQIEYNKLRQNNITTELLDILGGQGK